jgi:hypothetical protein
MDVVTSAVNMLQNNAVLTTEVKGERSLTSVSYPRELVQAARGLFKAGKQYSFEIHASSNLASNGAGSLNQTISWSPSTTTFAEWSALAALFDEVKLSKAHIDITSAFGPTSTAIIVQMIVAPDATTISGSTPSYTVVQRIAESEVFHCYQMARATPGRFEKTFRVPSRDWATTAAPAGASGMIAGCLGHWAFASNIAGTVSINYIFVALRHLVHLRLRA